MNTAFTDIFGTPYATLTTPGILKHRKYAKTHDAEIQRPVLGMTQYDSAFVTDNTINIPYTLPAGDTQRSLKMGDYTLDNQLGKGSPDFNNLGFSTNARYETGGYLLSEYAEENFLKTGYKYGDRLKGTGFFNKGGLYNKFDLQKDASNNITFNSPYVVKNIGDR
jgi:hypothetical protein